MCGADPWRIFLGVKGEGQRRVENADAAVLLGLIKVRQIRAQDFRWAGLQGFTLRLSVQLDPPRSHSLSLQSHAFAHLPPHPTTVVCTHKHTPHCLTVSGHFPTHSCLAGVPAANFIILAAANVSGSDCTEGLLCVGARRVATEALPSGHDGQAAAGEVGCNPASSPQVEVCSPAFSPRTAGRH